MPRTCKHFWRQRTCETRNKTRLRSSWVGVRNLPSPTSVPNVRLQQLQRASGGSVMWTCRVFRIADYPITTFLKISIEQHRPGPLKDPGSRYGAEQCTITTSIFLQQRNVLIRCAVTHQKSFYFLSSLLCIFQPWYRICTQLVPLYSWGEKPFWPTIFVVLSRQRFAGGIVGSLEYLSECLK